MRRVSNRMIWAGTAAVAYAVVLASLLYGGEPSSLVVMLVALVVLAGAVLTKAGRRPRGAARFRATTPAPTVDRPPERPVARPTRSPSPQRVEPRTPPPTTTATGVPVGPEARRAGARGESLGDPARPKPGSPD